MSDTTASLRRKIAGAGDLQSVVRTMKAVAASSIGQYEKSVSALADYYRAVELGLGACFRESGPAPLIAERKGQNDAGAIGAVVFGSDQGLVGQFNDVVADFAIKTLAALPGKPQVWAVGERVHERLADAGLPLIGSSLCRTPSRPSPRWSGRSKWRAKRTGRKASIRVLYVFHNRPQSGALYAPVSQRLLPLDAKWRTRSGQGPLAHGELARNHGWRFHDSARTHPRVSFCLALPGVRGIPGERECQPPGRYATRRKEHRRITGGPQPDISSFAPRWHR